MTAICLIGVRPQNLFIAFLRDYLILATGTMTLFVFATTATEAGVVAPELRFVASVGLRCGVMMIMGTIRAEYMRFRWLGLGSGHEVDSGQALLRRLFKYAVGPKYISRFAARSR